MASTSAQAFGPLIRTSRSRGSYIVKATPASGQHKLGCYARGQKSKQKSWVQLCSLPFSPLLDPLGAFQCLERCSWHRALFPALKSYSGRLRREHWWSVPKPPTKLS